LARDDSADRILQKVRIGCPLVLLDDRKEREGDLFCAAAAAAPEVLQFMVRRGSGLLCLALPRERLEEIGIPRITEGLTNLGYVVAAMNLEAAPEQVKCYWVPWVKFFTSFATRGMADTPFHFPVDLAAQHSGISVVERLETIQALLKPEATIDWFTTPGHLFTLGAHAQGMQGRWGHTEASVVLCRAAGLLCEIVGDDGNMLRGADLETFAAETNVEILPVSAIPGLLSRQAALTPG